MKCRHFDLHFLKDLKPLSSLDKISIVLKHIRLLVLNYINILHGLLFTYLAPTGSEDAVVRIVEPRITEEQNKEDHPEGIHKQSVTIYKTTPYKHFFWIQQSMCKSPTRELYEQIFTKHVLKDLKTLSSFNSMSIVLKHVRLLVLNYIELLILVFYLRI